MKYIALLRGINVGGKSLIKMAELKTCFEALGFTNVQTYINSGNVLFESKVQPTLKLSKVIEKSIEATFSFPVRVVVINEPDYRTIMQNIPKGWGDKPDWRYNLLFLIPPYDTEAVMADIGVPKPGIEIIAAGNGVIYQALEFNSYGRTTGSKLPSRLSYKTITIRNWNTARKLLTLLEKV